MAEPKRRSSWKPILIVGSGLFVAVAAVVIAFAPIADCPTYDALFEQVNMSPESWAWLDSHPGVIPESHRREKCECCGGTAKVTWLKRWKTKIEIAESFKRQGSPF
jgi:hypothetical protein